VVAARDVEDSEAAAAEAEDSDAAAAEVEDSDAAEADSDSDDTNHLKRRRRVADSEEAVDKEVVVTGGEQAVDKEFHSLIGKFAHM
jgi:hypothetical protein